MTCQFVGVTQKTRVFAMENNTFFYFAYGSNLLTERIRINNPSARAKGIGVLKEYKLDFNNKSKVSKSHVTPQA